MNQASLNNIDSLLSCPICMERFDSEGSIPICLPTCGHLLCKKCCKKIIQNEYANCPICRIGNRITNLENMKDGYERLFREISKSFSAKLTINEGEDNDKENEKDKKEEKNFKKIQEEVSSVTEINNLIKLINQRKKEWNDIPIRIAFVGKCNVGKSTLINTIRGLAKKLHSNDQNTNQNNLAEIDLIQCTKTVTGYIFNNDKKILLCDLPGVGTPQYRQNNEYLEEIAFDSYDYFVLLTNDGFFESDEWLLKKIVDTKKKFSFVYTKVDSTIRNFIESFEDYESWSEEERKTQEVSKLSIIREECKKNIEQIVSSRSYNLYLLSGHKTKTHLYDYKIFYESLYTELPDIKKNLMTMTIKPISDNIILRKVEILNKRIDKWEEKFKPNSSLSRAFNFIKFSIYNIFVNFLRDLIFDEIEFYKNVFYIDKKLLNSTKNDEVKRILEKYEKNDELVVSLAEEMFDDSTLSKTNNNKDNHEIEMNMNFLDYIKGTKSLSSSDQIKYFNKAFEFLRFAVENLQTACVMILSTEIKSISEIY